MIHTAHSSGAAQAIDTLVEATALNRADPLRNGSLLEFPAYGQLVMTGDMHGHRRNFEKLCKYADLARASSRHVILHELIHQETLYNQPDTSYELLIEAAGYKCRFPDQVHFIQSNHELAQLTGQRISKGGRDVVQEFSDSVVQGYGARDGEAILKSICAFIASFPLAARTPNRVWLSHSLPNEREMSWFDPGIVHRTDFNDIDRHDGGSVYSLVWGRYHSPALLTRLGETWDVDIFITGHQPQETGYAIVHERLIIIASDHQHGVFLPFDLSKPQTVETLERSIRKFVEVA